jgi:PAS domain S-box-containing protein
VDGPIAAGVFSFAPANSLDNFQQLTRFPFAEQENDDDIGALGSILSWDDDDQGNEGGNGGAQSCELPMRGTSASSTPPDMVQFSVNDGMSQFSFLQQQGLGSSGSMPPSMRQTNSENDFNVQNMTLRMPLPTRISNFSQQNGNFQQMDRKATPPASTGSTAQLHQLIPQAQSQQAIATNFAQLLAQQAGNMLMQQQQQQQKQQCNQSHPSSITFTMPAMQVQTQQQPQQQVQLAFTADPNTFLQQFQFAQLQQQLQAAQSQQHASSQMTMQSIPNQQQQRPHVPIAAAPVVVTSRPKPPLDQPASKRARTSSTSRKGPSQSASDRKANLPTDAVLSAIVSASDTDGEFTKRSTTSNKRLSELLQECNSLGDYDGENSNDKAQVNRDRNREHARNTRLRKKAYLEKLKVTVDELCKERDTLVSERTGAANLLVEMHNTRTEVLMSFFALRSSNEKRRKLWASILDESNFACVMPVTPYRSFPTSEVQVSKCQRTILGIDAMMADTASLHVLFDSLVDRSKFPFGKIDIRFTLVTEEAVVAGSQMMARWVMTTTNAIQCGARMEVAKQGMVCCKFNSAHIIVGLELMFDVMAFMLQLKQASGSDGFSVVPNTVQTCQRTFDKPMAMTLADPPYRIVQVNKPWEDMTGYTAAEVVGKASCSILQKVESRTKGLTDMMGEVRFKRAASSTLLNFNKSGEAFRNFLLVFPLSTDSKITHYLALTSHYDSGETALTQEGQANRPHQDIWPVTSQGSAFGIQKDDQSPLERGSQAVLQVAGVADGGLGQSALPAPVTSGHMPPPSTPSIRSTDVNSNA